MNAKSLLIEALKNIGADGLYYGSEYEQCGCGINDLAPCEDCNLDTCVAAKLHDGLYYAMEDQ